MPLNAMRKAEPLLEHMIHSLNPRRFITECAKADRPSFFRNFKGYRVERFGRNQLVKLARKELYERENEFWAQLIIVLWNNEHRELYNAVRERVQTIDEDVEKVERIEDELAQTWLEELLADYVLEDVLLCTYLNEVRFSPEFVKDRMELPLGIDRPLEPLAPLTSEDAEPAAEAEPEAEAEPAEAAAEAV